MNFSTGRMSWGGVGAFGDELAVIYQASKVNLGLVSEAGGGTKVGDLVTARTWQIPAAGGFMLHEDTVELRRYFEPELEVGVFQSASDLPVNLQRYLSNEQERVRVLKAGHRRSCEAGYTYDAAARAILEFRHSAARP